MFTKYLVGVGVETVILIDSEASLQNTISMEETNAWKY